MIDALAVDEIKTREIYHLWLKNWDQEVKHIKNHIETIKPDLILSNISFQILEVASKMCIPSIALSSLNWSLLVGQYLKSDPKLAILIEKMNASYNSSSRFIGVKPGLNHENVKLKVFHSLPFPFEKIDKKEILKKLSIQDQQTKISLITFGGMDLVFNPENWKVPSDWIVLVPDYIPIRGPSIYHYSKLSIPVSTLISGIDLIITKMGYGIASEIGAAQTPCFYLHRPGWPEEKPFKEWLSQRTFCEELSLENFMNGTFVNSLPAEKKTYNLIKDDFTLLDLGKEIRDLT
ncbi:MAG: hypothetical protein JNL11_13520 [Bdellovibrionaceae bacterium]|nr:hypothetical protein [Pseudobdellovibrionaceae bacterium]